MSYNPSQVCFNPNYDPYFKNDLLSSCPLPKPNIYFNNRFESPVAYPKSPDRPPENQYPAFVSPWPGFLPSNFVPLVYVPTVPTSGHVNHRMLKYLKKLKNAVDANPLLATRNRTAAFPKNHVEIKFGSFPPADSPSEVFSESFNSVPGTGETNQLDKIRAKKMISHLKNYNRRRKKRENGGSNVYPLPKFVYSDHRSPEPTTFYDKNSFWSEILNICQAI